MTKAQRLQIRSSEIRQKLNELSNVDGELTDEQRSEVDSLNTEYADVETKLRAALAAEPPAERRETVEADAEHRERLKLRGKTGIADYLAAALAGVEVRGAAAEFAQSVGVGLFQRLPLALLAQFAPAPKDEHRAITPGPSVDGMVSQAIQFVFERTAAMGLGSSSPRTAPVRRRFPA